MTGDHSRYLAGDCVHHQTGLLYPQQQQQQQQQRRIVDKVVL